MAAMPPLEDARNIARELSFAAEFSPALINPELETPATIIGPKGKLAVKRFNVYRNNVTVSLIDALVSIYPAVQRITGMEFFRAMARFHVRATPPHSPLLFEYGCDFPAFIEQYEYAQSMPYLADVARIERAWHDAYYAADASPLAPEALAAIPPERLADVVFTPHPATRIVRSEFSAVTIFAANRTDAPMGLIESVAPEDALITRPDLEVVVRHLPPGGAIFLMHLVAGETLGAAVTAALEIEPSFDIPASISGTIAAGAFTTINFGDEQ
jgi:hypothetical protein